MRSLVTIPPEMGASNHLTNQKKYESPAPEIEPEKEFVLNPSHLLRINILAVDLNIMSI